MNPCSLLTTQLQEVGIMSDKELQRLDKLESEADERYFYLLLKIYLLCF